MFWQVGSSATLGTGTSFVGDILALTSITLNTGANIACGAALARNGAVTLDTNNIQLGTGACTAPLLPNVDSLAGEINALFANNPSLLPQGFRNLANLSPEQLAIALTQLRGEAGTGAAQAGTQAMNSFLSMVTGPFGNNRAQEPARPPISKEHAYKGPAVPAPDPRRWSIWAGGYGGQSNVSGDPTFGNHDRSARTYGYVTGLDYLVTPYTTVGFALGGGGTNFGLSDSLGGGRSDMFQAAVYSVTRYNAAYVSAALAYAWHRVSTDRTVLGHRSPHRRFLRPGFRRPDRGRIPVRLSGRARHRSVRDHALRCRADADLPHAVLHRDRRLRLRRAIGFRACL